MPHGTRPCIPVVCGRRAVQGDTLIIHRHAQHRHVIFPADDSPYTTKRRIDHRQGGAIAKAPDQPFRACRHQFAVFGDKAFLTVKKQRCAIDSAAFSFDHTHNDKSPCIRSCFRQQSDFRTIEIDRRFVVNSIIFPPFGLAQPDRRAERRALGIASQKGFRKHHQFCALGSGFADQTDGFLRGGKRVLRERSRLDHGC